MDCKECASNRHTSALHPGLAPWKSKSSPPASENGEGGEQADNQEVTSKCTEVCRDGMSLRACSKICLVSVFPEGQREDSRRMYAILDEQRNCSLVTSEFFSIFNVACSPSPYTLRTCSVSLFPHSKTTSQYSSHFTTASFNPPSPSASCHGLVP